MIDGLFTTTNLLAQEEQPLGWGVFFYLGITLLVIFGLITYAKTGLNEKVFKNPVTQWAEQAYLFIEHMCVNVIGPHGRKYMPFLMTLWLVIFGSNILGLFLPHSPMADFSLTLALAIVVFWYVQYEGIRQNGFFGHLAHFKGPKLDGLMLTLLITPLIFCIEFVSEWVKILSLSLRLFGNIFAGHETKNTIDGLAFLKPFPVLGEILFPLELLVAIVQAFVFVVLAAIYLSLVTHSSEEHQQEGAHGATAHAH